ncbi:MAG: hypothetical protein SGI71_13860 [Verrucomicrobiota bacterium]|nr:hypothetical protein [Verrucomicrobiota bacterium]
MAQISEFVKHGGSRITPRVMKGILKKIPLLKAEFTQLDTPKYPHLFEQLEFLADVVEDFIEGKADELPLTAAAEAAFALIYAHQEVDLIPDFVKEFGHADDSSVVRAVLIEHEKALETYAVRHGYDWTLIGTAP